MATIKNIVIYNYYLLPYVNTLKYYNIPLSYCLLKIYKKMCIFEIITIENKRMTNSNTIDYLIIYSIINGNTFE